MGLFELLLLAVGLAMDAFAVSICKGLAVKKLTIKESLICGVWFGAFQGIMPFIGFLVGSGFEKWIRIVAPWVAFGLLSFIGINMIREAFSEEEETEAGLDVKTMFIMAVATSIDALAVGITFVAVPVKVLKAGSLANTALAVTIIAVVTFFISAFGVKIGNLFGTRYKAGSEVMGGTILLFIGCNTLVDALDQAGAMKDSAIVFGMLIPLLGTVAGAAFVYAKNVGLKAGLRTIFVGGAGGIMFSISVWGLIEPAARTFKGLKMATCIPVFLCFCGGVLLQYLLDHLVPHTHAYVDITEGPKVSLSAEIRMMLAEVIHHIPEGIALGAIFAGAFMKAEWISVSTALILAVAIAVQNFPEALFVSFPAREQGSSTGKSFFIGVVSGMPVPLLGVFTLLVMILFPSVLPYVMTIAGGAMIFNTVEEFPQHFNGKDNDKGTIAFVICFALMMFAIYA